jgi:hypothetical protein
MMLLPSVYSVTRRSSHVIPRENQRVESFALGTNSNHNNGPNLYAELGGLWKR